jgi:transcriptional antiterminator NusG
VFRWYVINTYSGHEKKVKANLEHRLLSMGQRDRVREVVIPTEQIVETKDGQKVQTEKRVLPGYVLVNMEMTPDALWLVKNTPGVTGFVGAGSRETEPVPLSQPEVDRLLRTATETRPRVRTEFTVGETVKVIAGPLSDFTGEVAEISPEQGRLKVLVSIFGRETPAELAFDQVKKLT